MARVNNDTLTVAIIAVFAGLLGAYGLRWYMQDDVQAAKAPAVTNVPLASNELPAGKTISMGDIMLVPMTQEQIRQHKFSPETMLGTQQIIGRTIRGELKKDQPFLTTNFYPEGMGPNLSDRLKPGYRAVTINIANEGAIEGFAGAGSLVDVLFRSRSRTESREFDEVNIPETTLTLLQGVEVLALGRNASPGTVSSSRNLDSVTLAVTADQAAALKAVEGRGELSLALRSNQENAGGLANRKGVTLDSLLGIPDQPKPFTAEIYRGGTRQTLGFQRENVRDEAFGGIDIYRMTPSGGPALEKRQVGIANTTTNTNPASRP